MFFSYIHIFLFFGSACAADDEVIWILLKWVSIHFPFSFLYRTKNLFFIEVSCDYISILLFLNVLTFFLLSRLLYFFFIFVSLHLHRQLTCFSFFIFNFYMKTLCASQRKERRTVCWIPYRRNPMLKNIKYYFFCICCRVFAWERFARHILYHDIAFTMKPIE